ncbi:unnamed protein product [Dovyalis caffra]|uniref:Uncharacterized protein n=1 Tax=Dovyalis caffra TaxID=77055 RepID=A0AAV1SQF4_9ROSI|nr:unnamed protein product [Dovyalis caffra]
MKKFDFRPRTRQQTEAEMLKKLDEVKKKRQQEGNATKSQRLGRLGEVQREKTTELVVLDDSEDEVKFIEVRDRGECMKGKEFVSLDDDNEDADQNDGLIAGNVKLVENDSDSDSDGFISRSKMGVEIETDESCYGVELSREKIREQRFRSRLDSGTRNEDDNDSDNEIFGISEEDAAEGESNSDKDDKDYIDNSDSEDSEVESSESSDYVEEVSSKEEFGVEEDDEEDESEVRLKGKGSGVLLSKGKKDEDDDCGDKDDSFQGGRKANCVAKRTTAHHTSEAGTQRKKLGRVPRPLRVDVQDPHDDDFICVDDDGIHPSSKGTGSQKRKIGVQDLSGKRSFKRKRNRACKEDEVIRILADTILDQAEAPFEEKNEPVEETTLPLKFTFGVEESTPPEKSEEEKELDKLWAEFDLVLWSLNSNYNATVYVWLGVFVFINFIQFYWKMRSVIIVYIMKLMLFYVDQQDEDAADISSEVEADTATLCYQGKHLLVLHEEIGLKCKHCSIVDQEIRYCVPPFSTNPFGRSARRGHSTMQHDVLDGFNHQDSDTQSDCDPNNHAPGTVWDLIPGIGKGMHEHQREGFEFLWKNIAGGTSLDALKEKSSSSGGSGCIISHAPGTGKTRLAIVFIQAYMKLYPTCRPVIIAPRSMLLSWEAEFLKWGVDIPFHNLNKENFSGKENRAAMNFLKRLKPGQCSSASIRIVKLYSWKKETGILGISYGLFEKLAREDKGKRRVRHMTEDDQVRKALLELPHLIVLDEGHTPRNKQSLIWKVLSKVRTQRRIMLSGTPFQNNFDQLYNTLYLVNPKFADEISSKHSKALKKKHGLKENESRGNWFSLTNALGKVIDDGVEDDRLKEVRKVIRPFVHVHKGTILQEELSGLRESLVILEPVGLQKRLLDGLQNMKRQLTFNLDNWISSVSVHPSLLKESGETEELQVDWDELKRLRKNPNASVKTHFLMELIRLSESTNEKVLVFCQYLPPLNLICKQLESQFGWAKGKEVLYMDGALATNKRQSLISHFNDPQSISKVLLASTKACCEGISLVGASRVVLLDVVWNPSVETQAISRAYRLGQEKVVYVYHLVTSGEEEKYCRQVRKERLSELVFYSADKTGNEKKVSSDNSDDPKDRFLEAMVEHERLKDMFKKIIYEPRDSSLVKSFGLTDL